jgi:transcriptional regulator with XRE-family HTH domain
MARSPAGSTPIPVRSAMHRLGEHITTWRKLRQLTVAQVADRAGVTKKTVVTLEAGDNVGVETLLRVARALGVLESITAALDPYATDVGRLRADETLPVRVRHRRQEPS